MSDEETHSVDNDTKLLTAEYKDGQLQIVEVTPFDREKSDSILPDMMPTEEHHPKYIQVLDSDKGLVQLDLLNLTLVRCDDGEESYRLVANSESDSNEIPSDSTVTCVLQTSDGEEHDNQESYVIMEGDNGPLMLCQAPETSSESAEKTQFITTSTLKRVDENAISPPTQSQANTPSAAEILERAKLLQKAKAIISEAARPVRAGRRGRRRADEVPPAHELLTSPGFKLYLYSCKLCDFKCNAIKELAEHRSTAHGGAGGGGRARAGVRAPHAFLCARCNHHSPTHAQLLKHMQEKHSDENICKYKVSLNSKEVKEADVLVCGACGFESASRRHFRTHIETEHGATTS